MTSYLMLYYYLFSTPMLPNDSLAAFLKTVPGRSAWSEPSLPVSPIPAENTAAVETPRRPPHPIRRCFFCGTNTIVPRTSDPYFLTVLENGRSFNYCKEHWRKFQTYAPPLLVTYHRRHRLTRRHTVKRTIRELKAEMEDIRQFMKKQNV